MLVFYFDVVCWTKPALVSFWTQLKHTHHTPPPPADITISAAFCIFAPGARKMPQ